MDTEQLLSQENLGIEHADPVDPPTQLEDGIVEEPIAPTPSSSDTADGYDTTLIEPEIETIHAADNQDPQDKNETEDNIFEKRDEEISKEAAVRGQVVELGAGILVLGGQRVLSEVGGKTRDERDQILDQDQSKRKLYDLGYLTKEYTGEKTLDTTRGKPIVLSIGDQKGVLQQISGATETTLTCSIKMPDGTIVTHETPRIQVAFAQLIAEQDTIMPQFSDHEQAILSIYIDMLQNGENTQIPENLGELAGTLLPVYTERLEEMSQTNPQIAEALRLFKENRTEELLENLTNDLEERNRLKKLLESGHPQLIGLLLLLFIAGSFSAVASTAK